MSRFDKARLLAILLPASLLGGAYVSQYWGGLFPCEMCWWQRYPHFAALAFALLALLVIKRSALVALAALCLIASGAIGGFHAGVEYGWWEGLTSCTSTIRGTGEDLLKSIMNAPIVRCDVAPWSLFGISLAGYNFLISVAGGLGILWLLKPKAAS
jgi:disulfide bond formation protein DsbB